MVAPVPMEDIERMAALCMKDLDEEGEDDEGLEDDAELLVMTELCIMQYTEVQVGSFNLVSDTVRRLGLLGFSH